METLGPSEQAAGYATEAHRPFAVHLFAMTAAPTPGKGKAAGRGRSWHVTICFSIGAE